MNRSLAQLLSAHAINSGGLGFDSRAGQISSVSPAVRHRCDVSSELCSSGAKPQRWAPPLVSRFGMKYRKYIEDPIFLVLLLRWLHF